MEPNLTFDELDDVSVDHLRLLLVGGVPRHVDDLHREPNTKTNSELFHLYRQ